MANQTLTLDDRLYSYLLEHSLREDPVLAALRQATASQEMAVMQIAPEQGQFMAMLVRLLGARRTLEIGVFTGYSTLCVAQALPADGQIIACDINREWTNMARHYWQQAGVDDKIDLHLAPALKTLQALIHAGEQSRFDFAFIDADKTGYADYVACCHTLLRPGGLMAIDNTLWCGDVARPEVHDEDTLAIRRLNQQLHDDPRFDISLVPIGDGLTLLRKRED